MENIWCEKGGQVVRVHLVPLQVLTLKRVRMVENMKITSDLFCVISIFLSHLVTVEILACGPFLSSLLIATKWRKLRRT